MINTRDILIYFYSKLRSSQIVTVKIYPSYYREIPKNFRQINGFFRLISDKNLDLL